jgi:hypothetical protein
VNNAEHGYNVDTT